MRNDQVGDASAEPKSIDKRSTELIGLQAYRNDLVEVNVWRTMWSTTGLDMQ